ncbi:hypothetical protein [Niabella sp.]|uniref:hypothetical protein n=1 Tax=Niabella sp. TaxID=1962976 RepID=UPI002634FFA2|nr:hypothetical protein [Niabella sp.]
MSCYYLQAQQAATRFAKPVLLKKKKPGSPVPEMMLCTLLLLTLPRSAVPGLIVFAF